jgi:transposase
MKAYSEDLREKIVDAVQRRGMNKCQAARTFDVSLATVKRYARKSRDGRSLSPGKSPGRAPKMDARSRKLLEEDVKERPTATLAERSEYLRAVTGLRISRSVICRTIKKLGSTRKKGDEPPQNGTSSKEPPGG